MKKCIVISDSFKGTLSSLEICKIACGSISRVFPDCQVEAIPVADGGEGTVECFVEAIGAVPTAVDVSGPYKEPVRAVYCRSGDRAVIEMAAAAGLPIVEGNMDPRRTTTYGVGQMIRHAVEQGCTEILLGLGGSCTNDGGCGCAAALGTKFRRTDGEMFVPTGDTLDQISCIDVSKTRSFLKNIKITAMCDVDNPLHGPNGAAYVFSPQKGADPAMAEYLDGQLKVWTPPFSRNWACLWEASPEQERRAAWERAVSPFSTRNSNPELRRCWTLWILTDAWRVQTL